MNASGIERRHILLLGEDAGRRRALKEGLETLGFARVSEADDPIAALDIMHAESVDLLISERYIPFVRFLRTHRKRPAAYVPIIMLIAGTDTADPQEAIDAGVNRVVTRPLGADALKTHIRAVLEEARPFVESAAYVGPDRRRDVHGTRQPPPDREQDPALALTPEEIAVLLEQD